MADKNSAVNSNVCRASFSDAVHHSVDEVSDGSISLAVSCEVNVIMSRRRRTRRRRTTTTKEFV